MQDGKQIGDIGTAIGTEIHKRCHCNQKEKERRMPSKQHGVQYNKADRFQMNQRYGKSILLSFHDQQQHTDVKQHTAYIIEEGNAIVQTSHKHGIDDMQKDRQTDQVAINIIAVIVLIKFHPHARNPPIFPFPAVKQAVMLHSPLCEEHCIYGKAFLQPAFLIKLDRPAL